MKITAFPRASVFPYPRIPACDIALFGFGALGDVDYESELSGRTNKFEEAAKLSAAAGCGLLCGCVTDSRGLKRRSVAVMDRGRLLGISDMRHVLDGDDVKCGAGLGIYRVGGYCIGTIIDSDLYFAEDVQALSLAGCNLAVAILRQVSDEIPPLLVRSYAFLYGLPIVLVGQNVAYFADVSGAIACSNNAVCTFESSPRACHRLVTTRKRGLVGREEGDY